MRTRFWIPVLFLTLAMGVAVEPSDAQIAELPTRVETKLTPPLPVPFGPGEYLEYDVKLGFLGKRGEGHMAVVGLDTVAFRVSGAGRSVRGSPLAGGRDPECGV